MLDAKSVERKSVAGLFGAAISFSLYLPALAYRPGSLFTGFDSVLGNRWFSAVADRLQLNYGCAPSPIMRNVEGFAFWHAGLILLISAGATAYLCRQTKLSWAAAVGWSLAVSVVAFGMVYVDAIGVLIHPTFTCKTTSFSTSEFELSDRIVRHLCGYVGMTILAPSLVFGIAVAIRQHMERRKNQTSRDSASPV